MTGSHLGGPLDKCENFMLVFGIIFRALILKLNCFVISCFLFSHRAFKRDFVNTNPLTENFEFTVYKFVDFLKIFFH